MNSRQEGLEYRQYKRGQSNKETEKIIRIRAERTKQTKRSGADKMQKRGKDKHFTERGIIMQLFSGVIIGLQAVHFFTE